MGPEENGGTPEAFTGFPVENKVLVNKGLLAKGPEKDCSLSFLLLDVV